jgi:hypothetical protein
MELNITKDERYLEEGIFGYIVKARNEDFTHVITQKYGYDDYAVCFTDDIEDENEGYSERGTMEEIIECIKTNIADKETLMDALDTMFLLEKEDAQ